MAHVILVYVAERIPCCSRPHLRDSRVGVREGVRERERERVIEGERGRREGDARNSSEKGTLRTAGLPRRVVRSAVHRAVVALRRLVFEAGLPSSTALGHHRGSWCHEVLDAAPPESTERPGTFVTSSIAPSVAPSIAPSSSEGWCSRRGWP